MFCNLRIYVKIVRDMKIDMQKYYHIGVGSPAIRDLITFQVKGQSDETHVCN